MQTGEKVHVVNFKPEQMNVFPFSIQEPSAFKGLSYHAALSLVTVYLSHLLS